MTVVETLERLKTKGPFDPLYGICSNLNFDTTECAKAWGDNTVECFKAWEEYSGSAAYPVPSDNPDEPPSCAFDNASEGSMWNPEHPYAAARYRLLDHCINWFKERDM